jgi:hypothetical protein
MRQKVSNQSLFFLAKVNESREVKAGKRETEPEEPGNCWERLRNGVERYVVYTLLLGELLEWFLPGRIQWAKHKISCPLA